MDQAIDEFVGSVGPEGLSLGSLAALLGVVGGFVRASTKEETDEAEHQEVTWRR